MDSLIIQLSDESLAPRAGAGRRAFRWPGAFVLVAVRASLVTAQAGGVPIRVDVKKTGASVLSGPIEIANGTKTTASSSMSAVAAGGVAIADDDEIAIDVVQVGDGSGRGLSVTLLGYVPIGQALAPPPPPPPPSQYATPGTLGTFGVAGPYTERRLDNAQSRIGGFRFTTGAAPSELASVDVYATVITIGGSWHCELWSDAGGSPGALLASSVAALSITTVGQKTFTWTPRAPMAANTSYWIILTPDSPGVPDATFQAVANSAAFGSGRDNSIVAINQTGLPNSEDWRCGVNFFV